MKKTLALVLVSFMLWSCEEQGELTRDGFNSTAIAPNSMLRYNGVFVPTSGISVTGGVKIFSNNNQLQLQLDNFSISEGPDLKVYLSKSPTPEEYINLGNLTSATVYSIPSQVDFTVYKYVLIHCQQYNHLFAIAPLNQI